MGTVLRIHPSRLNQLLTHAVDQDQEQQIRDQYLTLYPYMMMQWTSEFVPYAEFRRRLLADTPAQTKLTAEEVRAEMAAVISQYETHQGKAEAP